MQMEIFIKGTGLMIKQMVMETINMLMGLNMKEYGGEIRLMGEGE